VMGLRGRNIPVSLVNNSARVGERFAHSFSDAIAQRTTSQRALA